MLKEVEKGIAVWAASVDHDHASGLTVRLQGEQSRTGENSTYKERPYLRGNYCADGPQAPPGPLPPSEATETETGCDDMLP